jgi:hypothetical protein
MMVIVEGKVMKDGGNGWLRRREGAKGVKRRSASKVSPRPKTRE